MERYHWKQNCEFTTVLEEHSDARCNQRLHSLRGTWTSVQNFKRSRGVVSLNVNPQWCWGRSGGTDSVSSFLTLGNTDVCTEFQSNPSRRCWNISSEPKWRTNAQSAGASVKKIKSFSHMLHSKDQAQLLENWLCLVSSSGCLWQARIYQAVVFLRNLAELQQVWRSPEESYFNQRPRS